MKYLITLTFLLSLLSCKKTIENPNTTKEAISKEDKKHNANKNYWHLEGKVGEDDVAIDLIKIYNIPDTAQNLDYFTASYYHLDQESPINLQQTDTAFVNNRLNLSAYIDGKDVNLSGTFDGLTYKGEWSENGKKRQFELKETYTNNATKFDFHYLNKNIVVDKNTADYQIQLASTHNTLINDTIKSVMFGKNKKGDFADLINKDFENYKSEYIKDVKEFGKKDPNDDLGTLLNYTHSKSILPVINTKNRIVLESSFYDYTGGAHGMHGKQYYNYDKKTQKFLTDKDVFNTNKKDIEISKVLTQVVKSKYNLKPNESLLDVATDNVSFLVKEIPFTSNYKITNKGIIFFYNAYDVTPYAAGHYEVFVNYTQLKPFLNPNFKP